MWATVSSCTSAISVDIAVDKDLTKKILESHHIPVPKGYVISSEQTLDNIVKNIHFPLVVKPFDANHGRGVTTNIRSREKLVIACQLAHKISEKIIIEKFVSGHDYRILVVNYQVVAVAKRTPAKIVGTGRHSIQELIALTNLDPDRGHAHENVLTTIKVDEITKNILSDHQLSLEHILPENEILYLKDTANLSAGGTATDVTDDIHPQNKMLAERIARLIGLDICGIDVIAKNINIPIDAHHGAVLEVNASPGLRMHLSPSEGHSRNVASPILDMLFPDNEAATIPVVAVTGTNGKTTVVRLIANMAKKAGYFVGFTTTEGIYLNNHLIYKGDCSGPASARMILQEKQVDFAVLECARGGILREGLGFDSCDISIITNITGDHLGLNDIQTLEELGRVKSVVAHSTKNTGYALLNAEDDLAFQLKHELHCNVALFSRVKNERIEQHCLSGGLAVYIENHLITVQNGQTVFHITSILDIPLAYQGTAPAMLQNILSAVLVGIINQFSPCCIAEFLQEFLPTPENTAGRMNLFHFPHCKIMLDYAHNEGAFVELKQFLSTVKCNKKIGIIGVPGDRRAKDIQKIGYLCAQLFDEIIIRHDEDGRGRTNQELNDLLLAGIHQAKRSPNVSSISDGFHALNHAIQHAPDNSFIFYTAEDVLDTVSYLKKLEKNTPVVSFEAPIA